MHPDSPWRSQLDVHEASCRSQVKRAATECQYGSFNDPSAFEGSIDLHSCKELMQGVLGKAVSSPSGLSSEFSAWFLFSSLVFHLDPIVTGYNQES